jgi:hypothetical protein
MKIVNNNIFKCIIGFIDGSIVIINSNYESNYESEYNYKPNFEMKDCKYLQNNYAGIKDIAISNNNNYMACVDSNDMLSVFDININQHIFSLNGFRVSSIIITNKLEIIGTGHFNSISHFVMPTNCTIIK